MYHKRLAKQLVKKSEFGKSFKLPNFVNDLAEEQSLDKVVQAYQMRAQLELDEKETKLLS